MAEPASSDLLLMCQKAMNTAYVPVPHGLLLMAVSRARPLHHRVGLRHCALRFAGMVQIAGMLCRLPGRRVDCFVIGHVGDEAYVIFCLI